MESRTNILITAVVLVTICATIDGITVNCTYGMQNFGGVGSVYSCIGRVSFDGNESVTSVHGTHETGNGNQDVRGFYLQNQKLHFFPTNIESFFPKTIAIGFKRNKITTVNRKHLIPFPNLESLSFWLNEITSIDGDLFDGLDAMSFIDFADNDILHVGHDLNIPLDCRVHFQRNPCIDETAATPDEVANLTLTLLRNCPPTISQIEDSLQKRHNLLNDGRVQSFIKNNEEMKDELATLRSILTNLLDRIAYLEANDRNAIDARNVEFELTTNASSPYLQ